MAPFDVPIALFIYNRPDHLRETFRVVRELQPTTLFILADGPKHAEDVAGCEQSRRLVQAGVDWPCRLITRFSNENSGAALSVSGGLNWVFSQVDRAVVLEDDCVADPSFFTFCEEMLVRYADDERVMQVSGTNLAGRVDGPASYGFTRYGLPCWGWATWARAWKKYEFSLPSWEQDREPIGRELGAEHSWWVSMVDPYSRRLHGWDVQWNVAIWKHRGRVIIPSVNQISNMGYGDAASFTKLAVSPYADLPRSSLPFPLVSPSGDDPVAEAGYDQFIEPKSRDLIVELGNFYKARGFGPPPTVPERECAPASGR